MRGTRDFKRHGDVGWDASPWSEFSRMTDDGLFAVAKQLIAVSCLLYT